jgi:photosystem II stability/assembly factor-like uncharacterized protein
MVWLLLSCLIFNGGNVKKYILLFVISLVLQTLVNAQSWRSAYNTPIVPISGGCMTDQNTAWLVGYLPIPDTLNVVDIFKSTDGGMTWVVKYQSISKYLGFDISFVNSTTGFVGLNRGTILKTTDGGDSWQTIWIPDTTYSNTKIHFFDANLGFSLATNGSATKIYKTTDGGNTWITTATIATSMEAMDFYSPTIGIATAKTNYLYYTSDGATWNKAPAPTFPQINYSRTDQWGLKFISATTAVSGGWGSSSVGLQPTIFLKTTDGGATWSYMAQASANLTYVNCNSIYFKDQLNGFAVGGSTNPGTVIFKTTDGGTNWVPLPSVAGFTPKIVMGYNDKVIVSGAEGNIIISSDFGNSWTSVSKFPFAAVSSINIINNDVYACGYDGTFFKSTDLGATFNMSFMVSGNKCLWSKGIYFLNENLGYAASQYGQVLKTTDAGASWIQVLRDSLSTSINNTDLYFINENIGFVVGNFGSNVDIIYKTTNGGGTWTNSQNKAFQSLNCIAFADEMHGAACGNKSAILFTTDQGTTWNPATVNTTDQLAINGITFYNGLNGIAVGTGIILKTTDGGATWNQITIPSYLQSVTINGICHDSSGILYSVGKIYCIKSTDGGNTWQNIMDSVFAAHTYITAMNSIVLDKSGFIWIAQGKGIITNSPVTGITKDATEPLSFKLEQNYPNPFNPSTTIGFTINKRGLVTLKLFDILGREVRLIYKGDMTAGSHKLNFNAANLASGIYFYSLQVNDQFTCRKMTLLK